MPENEYHTGMIERVVKKCKLGEEEPDILYWRRRTPAERLEALEEIRRSYNAWRYKNADQGLQRVLRIVNLIYSSTLQVDE